MLLNFRENRNFKDFTKFFGAMTHVHGLKFPGMVSTSNN